MERSLLKTLFFLFVKLKKKNWKMGIEKKAIIKNIKKIVGNQKVICALSGGVDSSVTALLIQKAIKNNLKCIMVDTGLMRKMNLKTLIVYLRALIK